MSNKLSHSQVSLYQNCSQAWSYRYQQGYKPVKQSAALIFGSAVDKAFSEMVATKDFDKAYACFIKEFENSFINNEPEYIPTSAKIVYSDSDLDLDLITEEDKAKVLAVTNSELSFDETAEQLISTKKKKGYEFLQEEQKRHFNYLNWLSLSRKGYYFLKAIEDEVLPKLEEILSLQEMVDLKNSNGDSVIGYVDIVARVKGHDTPVILDLKTSSMVYDDDSVILSPQLSLYLYSLQEKYKTNKAGYIVINKRLNKNKVKICKTCAFDGSGASHKTCSNEVAGKRCHGQWEETIKPKAYVQWIIDVIPQTTIDLVLDNYQFINDSISNKIVYRNLQSCKTRWGTKCDYFNLCYKNSTEGLVKK